MELVLSASASPATPLPADFFSVARTQQVATVALVGSDDPPLRPATSLEACRSWRAMAEQAGVRILVLQCEAATVPDDMPPQPLERLLEQLRGRLAQATALGAELLTFCPTSFVGSPLKRTGYAEVWSRVTAGLAELRHDAEEAGVALGLDPAYTGFLTSPRDAAQLVDTVNSPAVGLVLDPGAVNSVGGPAEWVRLLSYRLRGMAVRQPGDWNSWLAAARETAFSGPLLIETAGLLSPLRTAIAATIAPTGNVSETEELPE